MKWQVVIRYHLHKSKNRSAKRELGKPIREELRQIFGPGKRNGLWCVYSKELTNEALARLAEVLQTMISPEANHPECTGWLNELALTIRLVETGYWRDPAAQTPLAHTVSSRQFVSSP
jgi:hypothetical protein